MYIVVDIVLYDLRLTLPTTPGYGLHAAASLFSWVITHLIQLSAVLSSAEHYQSTLLSSTTTKSLQCNTITNIYISS